MPNVTYCLLIYLVTAGDEPRALHVKGKWPITESHHPNPVFTFLKLNLSRIKSNTNLHMLTLHYRQGSKGLQKFTVLKIM